MDFCPDCTDPDAKSSPIAAMFFGVAPRYYWLGLALREVRTLRKLASPHLIRGVMNGAVDHMSKCHFNADEGVECKRFQLWKTELEVELGAFFRGTIQFNRFVEIGKESGSLIEALISQTVPERLNARLSGASEWQVWRRNS